MKSVYYLGGTLTSVTNFLSPYFANFPAPTRENCLDLIVGDFALNGMHSIRHTYRNFLEEFSGKGLNTYYYTLAESKASSAGFAKITVGLALKRIPEALQHLPVLLLGDDTLVPKYGTHFPFVGYLFDHAHHMGLDYINAHDWVALTLSIPVFDADGRVA